MVDCDLNEKECVFDGTRLADMNYIVNKFHNGIKNSLDYGKLNLAPIIAAFKTQK